MLTPSVFGKDFFDDFDDMFNFPFWDDRDMKKIEKKLYGRRGKNMMKTDIKAVSYTHLDVYKRQE